MKYPPEVACNEQTFSLTSGYYFTVLKERCVIVECYVEIKVSI